MIKFEKKDLNFEFKIVLKLDLEKNNKNYVEKEKSINQFDTSRYNSDASRDEVAQDILEEMTGKKGIKFGHSLSRSNSPLAPNANRNLNKFVSKSKYSNSPNTSYVSPSKVI